MLALSLDGRPRHEDGFPVLPGSLPYVFVRQALGLDDDLLGYLLAAHTRLGPLYWVKLGFGERVLLCEGREGFDLLRSKSITSACGRRLSPALAGDSVFVRDGDAHRHIRAVMNGPFSPRGLSAGEVGAMTADVVARRLARWPDGRPFPILAATQEIALDVIFRILGIEADDLAEWHAQAREYFLAVVPIPLEWPGLPAWRSARARAWMEARLRAQIAAVRERPDALGLLAALVHGEDEEGRRLSERELLDNLLVLTVAGHETVASTLAWMTITLARRPDLWRALRDEAEGAAGIPRSPQEARAFPFAEALFREALRLYPPGILTMRETTEPVTLHGQRVPAGTLVGVSFGALTRDPGTFPDPARFDPGRWTGKRGAPAPLELVAFGGGPHFCLGYHLAVLEGVQFAVGLARRFGPRGAAPRIDGRPPRWLLLPVGHPSPQARITLR